MFCFAKLAILHYWNVMKRELILLRHTKSSWKNLSLPDFDRPLKRDRMQDATNMGKALYKLGLRPDLIISSPALRTKQTSELFCDKLHYDFDKVFFDKRIYESSAEEILQVVRETDAEVKTLIIVGHNPSLTHFTNLFSPHAINEIPTTGVVWLQFTNADWEIYRTTPCQLLHFFTPKAM